MVSPRLRTTLDPGELVLGCWAAGLPALGGRGVGDRAVTAIGEALAGRMG